jgi:hypothetical protein
LLKLRLNVRHHENTTTPAGWKRCRLAVQWRCYHLYLGYGAGPRSFRRYPNEAVTMLAVTLGRRYWLWMS